MSHRDVVCNLIKESKSRKIAEIGIWKGQLSRKIISKCSFDELVLIDPLSEEVNNFSLSDPSETPGKMKKGTYRCGSSEGTKDFDSWASSLFSEIEKNPNVRFIREKSEDVVLDFKDQHFDLVFIDAIHLYKNVVADIWNWLPKTKDGGILSGDDYNAKTFPGVVRAVDECMKGVDLKIHSHGVWKHVVTADSRKVIENNILKMEQENELMRR
jgi:hypothetical protein